ncbi:MAG: ATP-dependent DNA helicase RecG [Aaplasma endosymbiont of Hyalomma asiaticum]
MTEESNTQRSINGGCYPSFNVVTTKRSKTLGLYSSIYDVPGIDDVKGALLEKLCGGKRIVDLILHAPHSYVDRRNTFLSATSSKGSVVTFVATVKKHVFPRKKRTIKSPCKVLLETEIGNVWLIFFNYSRPYLESTLKVDRQCIVSGKLDSHKGEIHITHPDHFTSNLKMLPEICVLEPVYPVTRGLYSRTVHRHIKTALKFLEENREWLSENMEQEDIWCSWFENVCRMHRPESTEDAHLSRHKLSYYELLGYHAAMYFARRYGRLKGSALRVRGVHREQVMKRLGFSLTAGQRDAIERITSDQMSEKRMTVLLQGDVGSGKTVVALFALLNAIEDGGQVAFMVPTEILAEQHCSLITELLVGLNVKIALLTGRTKNKSDIKARLQAGYIDVAIGTHALFRESVKFHNLRLVVIDEQQRFGVAQRMKLIEKGETADILFITATPIPRTLEQILYGSMDRITLTDKPKCRLPVKTSIVKISKIDDVCVKLKSMLENGHKIYWICPFIEGTDENSVASTENRYAFLREMFGNIVGVSHGSMSQVHNENTLKAFHSGDIKVLVATSIIEVGINVPDATIIVIESPERFGLSQLHQLRGRVGRGDRQSFCILLHGFISDIAYRKLRVLRDSQDGFYIAEQDLVLRGGGDMLGSRQSGIAVFKFADPCDLDTMLKAHNAAHEMVKTTRGRRLMYDLALAHGYDLPKINY